MNDNVTKGVVKKSSWIYIIISVCLVALLIGIPWLIKEEDNLANVGDRSTVQELIRAVYNSCFKDGSLETGTPSHACLGNQKLVLSKDSHGETTLEVVARDDNRDHESMNVGPQELTRDEILKRLTVQVGSTKFYNLPTALASLIKAYNDLTRKKEDFDINALISRAADEYVKSTESSNRYVLGNFSGNFSPLDRIQDLPEDLADGVPEGPAGDFSPASGRVIVKYPFNNLVIKVLGVEHRDATIIDSQNRELFFQRITTLLRRLNYVTVTADYRRAEPLPDLFRVTYEKLEDPEFLRSWWRRFTDRGEFVFSEFFNLLTRASILLIDAHGIVWSSNTNSSQPVLLLFGFREESDYIPSHILICLLANWVSYHYLGILHFDPDPVALIQGCKSFYEKRRFQLVVSYDPEGRDVWGFILPYSDNAGSGFSAQIGLTVSSLQRSGKSLVMVNSCGSSFPQDRIFGGVPMDMNIPFDLNRGFSGLLLTDDLLQSSCLEIASHAVGWICHQTGSLFYLDHHLAKDLFGVTYFRAQTPEFNNSRWGIDQDPVRASLGMNNPYRSPCFNPNNRYNFPTFFGDFLVNNFRTLSSLLHMRNFQFAGCPIVNGFYQTYAVAGIPHSDYWTGFSTVSPFRDFFMRPDFNYNLRTVQGSLRTRRSFVYAIEGNVPSEDGSEDSDLSWIWPAGSLRGNRSPELLVDPESGLFRHYMVLERGLPSTTIGLIPTIKDVQVSETTNTINLSFTQPVRLNSFKVLVSPSSLPELSPSGFGAGRQLTDMAGMVVRNIVTSNTHIQVQFRDMIKILPRELWSKPFPDFRGMFETAFSEDAQTHFEFPYFIEIHLSAAGFMGAFAGNATESQSLSSFSYRDLFWVWQLPDPMLIRPDLLTPTFLEKAALRTPPYMIGLGQLYNLSNYGYFLINPISEMFSESDAQRYFILRIPILPRAVFCRSNLQESCKRHERGQFGGSSSLDGDEILDGNSGGDECVVRVCGRVPTDSSCLTDFFRTEGNGGRSNVDACKLGAATCCPNPSSSSCGSQLNCVTVESFESFEHLGQFRAWCESIGGTLYKECKFVGFERICCSDFPSLCQPIAVDGCCNRNYASGGMCNGELVSAQYFEFDEFGGPAVKKCPSVEKECRNTTPTPTVSPSITPTTTVTPTTTKTPTITKTASPTPSRTVSPSPTMADGRSGSTASRGRRGRTGWNGYSGHRGGIGTIGLPDNGNGINTTGRVLPFGWRGFYENGRSGSTGGGGIKPETPVPTYTIGLPPVF